jgi:hypothetical protein
MRRRTLYIPCTRGLGTMSIIYTSAPNTSREGFGTGKLYHVPLPLLDMACDMVDQLPFLRCKHALDMDVPTLYDAAHVGPIHFACGARNRILWTRTFLEQMMVSNLCVRASPLALPSFTPQISFAGHRRRKTGSRFCSQVDSSSEFVRDRFMHSLVTKRMAVYNQ